MNAGGTVNCERLIFQVDFLDFFDTFGARMAEKLACLSDCNFPRTFVDDVTNVGVFYRPNVT